MQKYQKSIELYADGIGKVEYVEHMGSDLTIEGAINRDNNAVLSEKKLTIRFSVPIFVAWGLLGTQSFGYEEVR
jgi:hypothetical protein